MMTELTLFACPKPFAGHAAIIQRNAISSWLRLDPPPKILLIGDDEGVAEIAAEFGVTHIPGVATSDEGTPRLDSIFGLAKAHSTSSVLGYINADIILLDEFSRTMSMLDAAMDDRGNPCFLLCTKRIDIEQDELIDFSRPDWSSELRGYVEGTGVEMNNDAIDMFIFNRQLYETLLPLALGRTAWDNYLLWQAREENALVINGAECFSLVHQAHDYGHVGWQNAWKGPEAVRNQELVGDNMMTIGEAATHVLESGRLVEGSVENQFDQAALGLQRLDMALKELRRGHVSAAEDFLLDAKQWLKGCQEQIAQLQGSWSWRLTKPLRFAGRLLH